MKRRLALAFFGLLLGASLARLENLRNRQLAEGSHLLSLKK